MRRRCPLSSDYRIPVMRPFVAPVASVASVAHSLSRFVILG